MKREARLVAMAAVTVIQESARNYEQEQDKWTR